MENTFVPFLFLFFWRQLSQSTSPVTNSFVKSIFMQAEARKWKPWQGSCPAGNRPWHQYIHYGSLLRWVLQKPFLLVISLLWSFSRTILTCLQKPLRTDSVSLHLHFVSSAERHKERFFQRWNHKLKLQDNTPVIFQIMCSTA